MRSTPFDSFSFFLRLETSLVLLLHITPPLVLDVQRGFLLLISWHAALYSCPCQAWQASWRPVAPGLSLLSARAPATPVNQWKLMFDHQMGFVATWSVDQTIHVQHTQSPAASRLRRSSDHQWTPPTPAA
jgi:hypothetical protein